MTGGKFLPLVLFSMREVNVGSKFVGDVDE